MHMKMLLGCDYTFISNQYFVWLLLYKALAGLEEEMERSEEEMKSSKEETEESEEEMEVSEEEMEERVGGTNNCVCLCWS